MHQRKWDDQKKRIANETKETIKHTAALIESELADTNSKLFKVTKDLEKTTTDYRKQRYAQERAYSKVDAEIQDLKLTSDIISRSNDNLRSEKKDLKDSLVLLESEVSDLKKLKSDFEHSIDQLGDKKKTLIGESSAIEQSIASLHETLSDLDNALIAKRQKYDKNIAILDAKLQVMIEKTTESRAEDDEERKRLALWQHKLEAKDNNLRIREAKVNQQEGIIARNHNLLKL